MEMCDVKYVTSDCGTKGSYLKFKFYYLFSAWKRMLPISSVTTWGTSHTEDWLERNSVYHHAIWQRCGHSM